MNKPRCWISIPVYYVSSNSGTINLGFRNHVELLFFLQFLFSSCVTKHCGKTHASFQTKNTFIIAMLFFFLQCKHNILYRIKSPSLAKGFRYSMFGISHNKPLASENGIKLISNIFLLAKNV